MAQGDFETMPVGTRAALKEAAETFRSYEQQHTAKAKKLTNNEMERYSRLEKAERNQKMADKLEALLKQ